MSYILEALKKSEQERGHGDSPNVQTIHTSSLQYQQKQSSIWPVVLTIVVSLNLILLGYFAYDRQLTSPVASQQPATTPALTKRQAAPSTPVETSDTVTVAVTSEPETVEPVFTERQPAVIDPELKPQAVAIRQAPAGQDFTITSLYDLPTDIQASLPELTFSAHVYSNNPAQRSVVINGNFMEEGDMLTSSLRLSEITYDGVVFDYDGMRFHSSVVSGWNIN